MTARLLGWLRQTLGLDSRTLPPSSPARRSEEKARLEKVGDLPSGPVGPDRDAALPPRD